MKPTLYVVIPCYNEEKVLPITAPLFLEQLQLMQSQDLISSDSKIMFVNDGSKDNTWNIIKQLSAENTSFIGISQSRNRNIVLTVTVDGDSDIA